jgi:hypothetical protein
MNNKLNKSIHYFRAVSNGEKLDLEKHVRFMLQLAVNVAASQVKQLDDKITQILSRQLQPKSSKNIFCGGVLLHIGSGTLNEHMRTMQNKANADHDIGSIQAPPNGHSFLSREAFVYIKQHHVMFCGHGLRSESVVSYLTSLNQQLYKTNKSLALINFDLYAVANSQKLSLIQKHGVRFISLNASVYDLTIQQLAQDSQSELAKILGKIKGLIKKDPTQEEMAAAEDIQAGVWLKLEGNRRASLEARKLIQQQAEKILSDEALDTGFFIETQKGEKIGPNDIRLSVSVRIRKYEKTNTLVMADVFDALLSYFDRLEAGNLTEQ